MVHFASSIAAFLIGAACASAHWRDSRWINTTEIHTTGAHLAAGATEQQQHLDAHNKERAAHGAKALVWDSGLAASAKSWASKCKFEEATWHNSSGQNLAAATGNPSIADEINLWNKELSDHNPSNPQPSHWTQVVWKGTTKVGCYMATCAPGNIFGKKYGNAKYVVCNYRPAGNVIGQFPKNVQK
ncbi:cysteine-rich Secretory family protein [Ceratobasidium sp. AG-Ba]|nr:cysteine-rich Secretory family protein [Ceratobasidium sp. AG-Ba]